MKTDLGITVLLFLPTLILLRPNISFSFLLPHKMVELWQF